MSDIKILHKTTMAVLATVMTDNVKKAVEAAIRAGTSLANADLSGQDLRGANLEGGIFTSANCKGTNFDGAVLRGADFSGATLTNASMRNVLSVKCNLSGADTTNLTHLPIG